MNYKIGIVGIGVVGGALYKIFPDAFIYDKFKDLGSVEEVNRADIVFICVPTPQGGAFSDLAVKDAISRLNGSKIVILRSTVLPGVTDKLQEEFPQHKILFNPEFLTEAEADSDIKYPDKQIIGYTEKSFDVAKDALMLLPKAPFQRIIKAKEAEAVKYRTNSYFASKVALANQFYTYCLAKNIDYSVVNECFKADKRVEDSHFEIWHKGYRGYGGKCLPKDVKTLLRDAKKNGVRMTILEEIDAYNTKLVDEQNKK